MAKKDKKVSKKGKKRKQEEEEVAAEAPVEEQKKKKKKKKTDDGSTEKKSKKKDKKKKTEAVEEEEPAKKSKKDSKKKKKKKTEAAAEEAKEEEEPKKKKSKKSKKDKKKKKAVEEPKEEEATEEAKEEENDEEEEFVPQAKAAAPAEPAPANATNKVFMGNLSYDIDDDKLKAFLKESGIDATPTDIHWLTDKETGNFYGSGFVEFESDVHAAALVKLAGTECLGRPLKADFAKPRPGGDRPAKRPARPVVKLTKEDKPVGCVSMFLANLSFDIDDEGLTAWVKDCGEVARIKWITDRETGDFKGCGFVDFYDTDAIDKLAAKQGEDCMGRPIRMDYAKPREPREGGFGGGGGGGGVCFAFQKGECNRGDSCKFKHEKE